MTIPDTAITKDGNVFMKWALEHRNLDPMQKNKVEELIHSSAVQKFSYNWNICGAWVTPEEAEKLIPVKLQICNCNNGVFKSAFIFGSQLDYNLWYAGNREGVLS